ncbi:cellulase family glycosylhydrolase [Parvibaculum sedimenti]|uniref:Cellulase family glycosylhydrolase n=1 Tax=Parvibaculum sedimenti TaxID=2608632 RepID=A0A6N6VP33_9HYPH|nr:cellulase family glycosylhydrolase [Parvibaculum sedimenti]KAB7741660.1 cellulase family glycosylhydrolase [Parvibaculum sedimenti]
MALPRLQIEGEWFEGEDGRTHILRGVNLGGDCKVPFTPNGYTNIPTDFSDHRTVSFIGRPFPLAEAAEHLGRLKAWGFNCVRLLTTWEAVEHAGPGNYDEAYLDYFATICRMADEHGLYVFIDFHQDVWSRMTGGDGAPGWTFETVGLDFTKFHAAGAAHVMQYKYDFARGGRQEDRYPTMTWSQNYRYPANALMWTFFFAGKAFCPDFMVEGRNVQDFLQDHYLGAMEAVAHRVKGLPNVLGFDSLNEPGSGYVEKHMSYRHVGPSELDRSGPQPGLAWSPIDGLAVARGLSRDIPNFRVDKAAGKIVRMDDERVNAAEVSIWLKGAECPFERAGAYRVKDGGVEVVDEFFFMKRSGHVVSMERDFMSPFFHRVADRVRGIDPDWLLFAEVDPWRLGHGFPKETPRGTVNASHWYDVGTLVTKEFRIPETPEQMQAREDSYTRNLAFIKSLGSSLNEGLGAPTLIGEFGIPFDLDHAAAYKAWAEGDRSSKPWEEHVVALDLMYNAMDALLISSTQWNYTASNRNDQAVGDGWNQEDLSIYSADQGGSANDINSGGRALEGFVRPYARTTAGRPLKMKFKRETGAFRYVYEATREGETEIFVPRLQYPKGFTVEVEGGSAVRDDANQRLLVRADMPGKVGVSITPIR